MRVLHLISSGGNYGAENMMLSLCTGLRRLGCDPVVGVFLNSHRPNIDTTSHAKRLGLECTTFSCNGRLDLSTVRAIRSYIVKNGIDLIHTHGYKADIYGYAAVRGKSIASVATCHSWPDGARRLRRPTLLLKFYGALDKAALKRFGIVAAVSDPLADLLARQVIHRNDIRSIPNGIDVEMFAKAQPTFGEEIGKGKRTVVGMIARLVAGKGSDLFLRAAQTALERFPDTIFTLIGNGPERKRLEELARELKIEGNIIFAGERHDMPEVYASLNMVVLPSLSEGMPMSILEAMAAGKPVVASSVGAIPSIVLPGRTGLLIEPGDLTGLREAIERLLTTPELCTRLGKAGQTLIRQHYSAETMARNYLDIYQQVLDRQAAA